MSLADLLTEFMQTRIGQTITNDTMTEIMELISKFEYHPKAPVQSELVDEMETVCVMCGGACGCGNAGD